MWAMVLLYLRFTTMASNQIHETIFCISKKAFEQDKINVALNWIRTNWQWIIWLLFVTINASSFKVSFTNCKKMVPENPHLPYIEIKNWDKLHCDWQTPSSATTVLHVTFINELVNYHLNLIYKHQILSRNAWKVIRCRFTIHAWSSISVRNYLHFMIKIYFDSWKLKPWN